MSNPLPLKSLRGAKGPFLALDPGKHCGLCFYNGDYRANTADLGELPSVLHDLGSRSLAFVICESFSLLGGNRRNDPSMPSSQGIGMARMACYAAQIPLILVSPQTKRAGHMALDAQGQYAFEACRTAHERDAVDLCGLALREMKLHA